MNTVWGFVSTNCLFFVCVLPFGATDNFRNQGMVGLCHYNSHYFTGSRKPFLRIRHSTVAP